MTTSYDPHTLIVLPNVGTHEVDQRVAEYILRLAETNAALWAENERLKTVEATRTYIAECEMHLAKEAKSMSLIIGLKNEVERLQAAYEEQIDLKNDHIARLTAALESISRATLLAVSEEQRVARKALEEK